LKDTTIEDIEAEIMSSYGIKVEVEQVEERKLWVENAKYTLSNAYSNEEPDYESIVLKEPNPDYNDKKG
jgi:hypothetical protein